MLFEIFTNGKEPYDGFGNIDTKIKVTSGEFLTIPDDCPQKLRDFIETRIYVLEKEKRSDMAEVVRFMDNIVMASKMLAVQVHEGVSTLKTQKESSVHRTQLEPKSIINDVQEESRMAMPKKSVVSSGEKVPSSKAGGKYQKKSSKTSVDEKGMRKTKIRTKKTNLGKGKFSKRS